MSAEQKDGGHKELGEFVGKPYKGNEQAISAVTDSKGLDKIRVLKPDSMVVCAVLLYSCRFVLEPEISFYQYIRQQWISGKTESTFTWTRMEW